MSKRKNAKVMEVVEPEVVESQSDMAYVDSLPDDPEELKALQEQEKEAYQARMKKLRLKSRRAVVTESNRKGENALQEIANALPDAIMAATDRQLKSATIRIQAFYNKETKEYEYTNTLRIRTVRPVEIDEEATDKAA